ncbi:MAG: magnesium/cobalt transporter CorA [Gammaproteobacteria bacterium]|nr:magnesium/cobalt transporter CorA [Gammaproteobacteria bacterium]
MGSDTLLEEGDDFSPELSPVVDPVGETPVSIILVRYNQEKITEHNHISALESQSFLTDDAFTWIHVQGQPKPSTMLELGRLFNLHALALEDVINIGERSKTETYENQVMVILGMPTKKGHKIINEQVSFFLGDNFLVSFHNGENDPFRAVRRRLHHPQAPLRSRKLDYLLYVLVDVVIDHCFPILDEFDADIQEMEQQLLGPEGVDTFRALYTLKRELLVLRLKIRPQREAIRVLMRDDNQWLSEETKLYMRDCFDHVIRLIDIIEIYRDMTTNMLDVHLSLVNQKTFMSNEVQRKATVWAMLFAPLTFITGIYGMNFANMPESSWRYGFLGVIFMMFVIAGIMVVAFKRRNWL